MQANAYFFVCVYYNKQIIIAHINEWNVEDDLGGKLFFPLIEEMASDTAEALAEWREKIWHLPSTVFQKNNLSFLLFRIMEKWKKMSHTFMNRYNFCIKESRSCVEDELVYYYYYYYCWSSNQEPREFGKV